MIIYRIFKFFKIKTIVLALLLPSILMVMVPIKTNVTYAAELNSYISGPVVQNQDTRNVVAKIEQTQTPEQLESERQAVAESARIAKYSQKGILIDSYLNGKRSPLAGFGLKIAELEDKYKVPAKLVLAIAGTESGVCRVNFRAYNCWGWMTKRKFTSYNESLEAYFSYVKNNYPTLTAAAMAKKYCPPTWESWMGKVNSFMSKMNF